MPSVLKWLSARHQKKGGEGFALLEGDYGKQDKRSPEGVDHGLEDQTVPPVTEIPSDLEEQFDVPYVERDGVSLIMDIYRPKQAGGEEGPSGSAPLADGSPEQKNSRLPVIILIHGGAMMVGHPRMERKLCERLARKGFLVFAPAYRLITEADGIGEISDVTAAFSQVGRMLESLGGDPDRIYVAGESAGAWLALYATAMTRSEKLSAVLGLKPAAIRIRGILFISGMFYTTKKDLIGLVYPPDLFGKRRKDPSFMEYMDPEHEEIIKSLPPVILTSSRADFLRKYSLSYARALRKAGHKTKLIYYKEKNKALIHSFVALYPDLPESRETLDRICRLLKL